MFVSTNCKTVFFTETSIFIVHLILLKPEQPKSALRFSADSTTSFLQSLLFEVELIMCNAPLIYVYLNIIKTSLTLNFLLFGRQLLLSFNATLTVAMNLIVFSSTTDKINCITASAIIFGIGGDINM